MARRLLPRNRQGPAGPDPRRAGVGRSIGDRRGGMDLYRGLSEQAPLAGFR